MKIVILLMALSANLINMRERVHQTCEQLALSVKRVIIQGCDDVDPGDEDHFE